jgi:hypothetical protein
MAGSSRKAMYGLKNNCFAHSVDDGDKDDVP